jgi:hypothetical protein
MTVEIPRWVAKNPAINAAAWASYPAVVALSDYRDVDVPDVLIDRRDLDDSDPIWWRLRAMTPEERLSRKSKRQRRDNPVVHVKSLVDVFPLLPPLASMELTTSSPIIRCSDPSITTWDVALLQHGNSFTVTWTERTDTHVMTPYDRVVCSASVSANNRGQAVVQQISHIYFKEYQPGSQYIDYHRTMDWNWQGIVISGGSTFTASDVMVVFHHFVSQYYSTTNEKTLVFNLPDYPMTDSEIVQTFKDDMLRALRYNELELFARSRKHHEVNLDPVPQYDLEVMLAEAWSKACEPSAKNRGIPTLGFNNLQNLLAAKDGMVALAFGKGQGKSLNAFGDLATVAGYDFPTADFLWRRFKNKTPKQLSKDPYFGSLTKEQQRMFMRKRSFESTVGWSISEALTASTLGPLQDKWFEGRYVWSTGWSDADQAWNYFYTKMRVALHSMEECPVLHGKFQNRDGVTARVSFRVKERVLSGLANMWKSCYMAGVMPTASIIWDFIPYSFVADWFFPISSTLEQYDKSQYFTPQFFEYLEGVCCSVKYESQTPRGIPVRIYARWYQPKPPQMDLGHHWIENPDKPSSRTECFRTVDGIFLLLRRS